jgi:hypothetical protein
MSESVVLACEEPTCQKTLTIWLYVGDDPDFTVAEEARDEGWTDDNGKWFCNEHGDEPGGVPR